MYLIRQGAALSVPFGPMVSAADGSTVQTLLSIAAADVKLLTASSLAAKHSTGAITEAGDGYYYAPLDATDTATVQKFRLCVTLAGSLPCWIDCEVLPPEEYDARTSTTANAGITLATIAASTGLIIGGRVTARSPVTANGTLLTLVQGDDYTVASGQALEWTDAGNVWPTLTGATILLTIRNRTSGAVELSKAGTVVTPTGTAKCVRVQPTAAETATLTDGDRVSDYDVQATLTTGEKVTLVLGMVTVIDDNTA